MIIGGWVKDLRMYDEVIKITENGSKLIGTVMEVNFKYVRVSSICLFKGLDFKVLSTEMYDMEGNKIDGDPNENIFADKFVRIEEYK